MFMPSVSSILLFPWIRLSFEQCSLIVVTQIILAGLFHDTSENGALTYSIWISYNIRMFRTRISYFLNQKMQYIEKINLGNIGHSW